MIILGVRPPASPSYATHLPILIAISKVCDIRRVLELGSGAYSTALYLDKAIFPNLVSLVSLENDPEWADTVLTTTGSDSRLDLRLVSAIPPAIPDSLDEYDLIFVDDSRSSAERSATIREVVRRRPAGLVAIHDFEQRSYRRAASSLRHRFVFGSFTPQVGVVWSTTNVNRSALVRARRLVDSNASIPVTDTGRWATALAALSSRGSY